MVNYSFLTYEFIWYALFALAVYFSLRKCGKFQTAAFFIPAIMWGFALEFSTIEIFHRYFYGSDFLVYVFGVPLNITLAWATLIFVSYYLLKEKLKLSFVNTVLFSSIPLIIIDLLVFEPLAFYFGFWKWVPESLWFGSPVGNIIGWYFAVSLFVIVLEVTNLYIKNEVYKLLFRIIGLVPALLILQIVLNIWATFFGIL